MSLIKRGDLVEVISGPYKGERGKVIDVDRTRDRILVEGINLRVKHEKVRPNKDGGQSGGIIEREAPVHASNVMAVDPETDKPVRLGVRIEDDGTKKRVTRGRNASGSVLE